MSGIQFLSAVLSVSDGELYPIWGMASCRISFEDSILPFNWPKGRVLPIDPDNPAEAHDRVRLAAKIITAFAANNDLPQNQLSVVVSAVYRALLECDTVKHPLLARGDDRTEMATSDQVRKSIMTDALISFIDGQPRKMLKRHLSNHGMTPESYRARYGLPVDYPMTASSHSERRAALAKASGFGRSKKQAVE